jgi:hypothetical protein
MAHKGKQSQGKTIDETYHIAKVYIPSWAQFPDDFHPVFFASQKLTEQTQRRA